MTRLHQTSWISFMSTRPLDTTSLMSITSNQCFQKSKWQSSVPNASNRSTSRDLARRCTPGVETSPALLGVGCLGRFPQRHIHHRPTAASHSPPSDPHGRSAVDSVASLHHELPPRPPAPAWPGFPVGDDAGAGASRGFVGLTRHFPAGGVGAGERSGTCPLKSRPETAMVRPDGCPRRH